MFSNAHRDAIQKIIKWLLFGKIAVQTRSFLFYSIKEINGQTLEGNIDFFYELGVLSTLMCFGMIKRT